VHEKLDKTAGNVGLDDCLDLIVGSVRKVRDGPACIDENLVIQGVDKLGKNRESRRNL